MPGSHDQGAADGKHRDAHHRAGDAVKVVFLELVVMRFVMVAVPAPAETVHDIFVARPGDTFHRNDGSKDSGQDRKNAHRAKIGAFDWHLKAILACASD